MPDTITRSATFAGFLSPGDCVMSEDCSTVTIDRKPRDVFQNVPALKAELASRGLLPAEPVMLESAGAQCDPALRSARPYLVLTHYWQAGDAGRGIEEICQRHTADTAAEADKRGFLPDADLEVWLLPVLQPTFDYLVTPAGEWPA